MNSKDRFFFCINCKVLVTISCLELIAIWLKAISGLSTEGSTNQSLRFRKPRLCLRGPGQELPAGEALGEAGWFTTVPRFWDTESVMSGLGESEWRCSWGCRWVWLCCWCSVCTLPAFAWACASTEEAWKRKIVKRAVVLSNEAFVNIFELCFKNPLTIKISEVQW